MPAGQCDQNGPRVLGLGVVLGSNIFNLAALLGGGALAAGCIRTGRTALWLVGGVQLALTVVTAARLFDWIRTFVAVALGAEVFSDHGFTVLREPPVA